MRTHRGANGFRGEIVGWRARGVQRYTERGNGDRIKKRIQMEKTVGFQPRYHLNTYITEVEALFQCLHSFFIRLSLNATAPLQKKGVRSNILRGAFFSKFTVLAESAALPWFKQKAGERRKTRKKQNQKWNQYQDARGKVWGKDRTQSRKCQQKKKP